jgi:hypothetical protein
MVVTVNIYRYCICYTNGDVSYTKYNYTLIHAHVNELAAYFL